MGVPTALFRPRVPNRRGPKTGRNEVGSSPQGNGQHRSAANGAGSAVEGTPIRVEATRFGSPGRGMESGLL